MLNMIQVIIAGGRDFNDYELLCSRMDHLLSKRSLSEVTIISGCAKGADSLAIRYASDRGYSIQKFPADWDKYGKRAGILRNEQMANVATHLVAFWDGKSKGTSHMIQIASDKGMRVVVVNY